jgi:toxic protein SymE
MLRIQGLWFQELGFNIGDSVLVKCEDGKLIITQDTARAELMGEEQAFMEAETKKLEEKFRKERKQLRARFVAERCSGYWQEPEMG